MPWFRMKPIKAEQWFPGKEVEGVEECSLGEYIWGRIEALQGKEVITPGDWIVTNLSGNKYRCPPGVFEGTYDPIEED